VGHNRKALRKAWKNLGEDVIDLILRDEEKEHQVLVIHAFKNDA